MSSETTVVWQTQGYVISAILEKDKSRAFLKIVGTPRSNHHRVDGVLAGYYFVSDPHEATVEYIADDLIETSAIVSLRSPKWQFSQRTIEGTVEIIPCSIDKRFSYNLDSVKAKAA